MYTSHASYQRLNLYYKHEINWYEKATFLSDSSDIYVRLFVFWFSLLKQQQQKTRVWPSSDQMCTCFVVLDVWRSSSNALVLGGLLEIDFETVSIQIFIIKTLTVSKFVVGRREIKYKQVYLNYSFVSKPQETKISFSFKALKVYSFNRLTKLDIKHIYFN